MFYRDDVVRLMWQKRIVFVKQAILTPISRSLTNVPTKLRWYVLAHSLLAS